MGWFKLSVDKNDYGAFMALGAASSVSAYICGVNSTGTTLMAYNGTTLVTGTDLPVGTWGHVAMVVDGTTAGKFRVYLNGVLDITNAGLGSISAAKMFFGNDGADHWNNGCLQYLKVYEAALTAAEILTEKSSATPVRTANLNRWCVCEVYTDVTDKSGNGYNLTANGTLTTEAGPPVNWSLAGQFSGTDEILNNGVIARGTIALGGQNAPTDEISNASSLAATRALAGQAVTSDEAGNAGAIGIGGINLTGTRPTTDESFNSGQLAAVIALSGQTDATDEGFPASMVSPGPINLAGQQSVTDETASAGQMTLGTITLSAVFIRPDEIDQQAALSMTATLLGERITTDEALYQAALGRGAVELAGQFIKPDEQVSTSQVQASINLTGSTMLTDETILLNAILAVINLAGAHSAPDEQLRTNTISPGTLLLLGVFSKSDERMLLSVLIQSVTRIVRRRGPYARAARRAGGYSTSARNRGAYRTSIRKAGLFHA